MKLQTPRTHNQFLEEKGMLDDFIEAKVNGQDAVAKWYLLDSAKEEMDKI